MIHAERAVLFLYDRAPRRRDPLVSPELLALLVSRAPTHSRDANGESTYVYELDRTEIAGLDARGDPERQRELVEISGELRGLSARLAALGVGDVARMAELGAQGALCVAIGERLAAGPA
jgi:hypothetical protein